MSLLIVLTFLVLGIGVSLFNGNRNLPLTILGISVMVFFSARWVGSGMVMIAFFIMAVVIWLANRFDRV